MTENERKEAAEQIIIDHGEEVEYLTVVERVSEWFPGSTDKDHKAVDDLIGQAEVKVFFDD